MSFFRINRLLAALQFLTILPIRREIGEEDIGRSQVWFPSAGLVIGVFSAICYQLCVMAGFPLSLAALLGIFALSGFSGFLHMDGVADTADGFFSSRPKEKILEIMRDSRIGSMGVLGIAFVLGAKWASLGALSPSMGWRVLVFAPLAGRAAQVLSIGLLPYARAEGGLVSVFKLHRSMKDMLVVLGITICATILLCGGKGLFALFFASIFALMFSFWCKNKICGMTGDTLGAITELTEVMIFCVMCIGMGEGP